MIYFFSVSLLLSCRNEAKTSLLFIVFTKQKNKAIFGPLRRNAEIVMFVANDK